MAKKLPKLSIKIDTAALLAQFSALRGRHVGLWPPLPRGLLMFAVFASIVAAGYGLYWRGLFEELDMGRQQEEQLKAQYVDKIKQAVNLPALRKQKEQVLQFVSQLEKQLPSKAEMDALLSDINQAGVGRGAQLVLFKPGETVVKEYYAELPITVRVVGSYHDLGAFASDLANLPRIVTLHNVQIAQQDRDKGAILAMDATAKTFRYLDPEEIAQQRAAAAKKKSAEAKK
ncbi:MAG: type 4a pilus biogenesis protein PilO [Burkholderiaceae bacterium]|jgi:type IV pilus assembly protein PilO|nr:type 4a pilus biogenesis protein PilO [Burkholderiales bacterium]MCZ8096695.1 type 4a pilus biogenesis protein PilO [Burkholderiales bacterium]MCZ8337464.1 type 4a pilus biogenesis protein PilO [Burkholderiaceae bacterium]